MVTSTGLAYEAAPLRDEWRAKAIVLENGSGKQKLKGSKGHTGETTADNRPVTKMKPQKKEPFR